MKQCIYGHIRIYKDTSGAKPRPRRTSFTTSLLHPLSCTPTTTA